jgi:hypothetical protein
VEGGRGGGGEGWRGGVRYEEYGVGYWRCRGSVYRVRVYKRVFIPTLGYRYPSYLRLVSIKSMHALLLLIHF